MIALVANETAGLCPCWSQADLGEVARGRLQRPRQSRRVAFIGWIDRCRNDDAGVEIDRVLGLVGQMRGAVLHPRDLRIRIGRARPILVRKLLALPPAIEPDEVVDRRRFDATLLRHLRQHLAIGLAAIAPHDGSQGGVGFHRRAVDADPLALHQAARGDESQNPVENLFMDLVRQPAARLRQPGTIGNLVPVRQPQKRAKRQRIRTAPSDAALAADALEIADHVHPEITPRRQRRSPHPRCVVWLARRLHEAVKARLGQQLMQPVGKRVSRRTRHLRPCHHEVTLNLALSSQCHRTTPV